LKYHFTLPICAAKNATAGEGVMIVECIAAQDHPILLRELNAGGARMAQMAAALG